MRSVVAPVSVRSTSRWATLRLLGTATWGVMRRPSPDVYVLRDRRTLRAFGPCEVQIDVVGDDQAIDVEIDVCKGETGRVTVRTDGDIAWNALEGPLEPDRHHCKTVVLTI